MSYGPAYSSSEEDGFSDDNDYYEFKQRLKNIQTQQSQVDIEAEKANKRLKTVYSAIIQGKDEILLQEVENGFDVNTTLDYEYTPLLLAASKAQKTILSYLISKGAQLDVCRDSLTVLMLVCNNKSKDEQIRKNILACVKHLLEHNVDVNLKDSKRRTAIMFAALNNHLDTVKFLLPLVDKDVEDNQKWNVLFWAVEGDSVETVRFLLEYGFSHEKTDIRGHTIADVAQSNGSEQILDLLPKNPLDDFLIYFNANRANFEETFSSLGDHKIPTFFHDVCNILYSTRSESAVSNLLGNNINLLECLSLSNSKLKEIGVVFPFQRRRILQGLYKFHKHSFRPQSVPFVNKKALYTNLDVSSEVLTCIKQLIAMEASLVFILENFEAKLNLGESKEVQILVSKNRQQINRLKSVSLQLVKKTEHWDEILKPADKITKKRRNIPWAKLSVGIAVITVVVLVRI